MVAVQTTAKEEKAPKAVSRRPEMFDVLFDNAMSIQADNRAVGARTAQLLNERGSRPTWFQSRRSDGAYSREVMEQIVSVIAESEKLSDEVKWAYVAQMQYREKVWSRIIGLISLLDKPTLNMLASTAYVADEYVAGEKERRIARVTGSVHRWLERFCNDNTLLEAECALVPLANGRMGRVSLGNRGSSASGFVESRLDSDVN